MDGTTVYLDSVNIEHLSKFPYIKTLTIDDNDNDNNDYVDDGYVKDYVSHYNFPLDCIFLTKNKTKTLIFYNYPLINQFLETYLKYFKHLTYMEINAKDSFMLPLNYLSSLQKITHLYIHCEIENSLDDFYKVLSLLPNLKVFTMPENTHTEKNWNSFKDACEYLSNLTDIAYDNFLLSLNSVKCILNALKNLPKLESIYLSFDEMNCLDYLLEFLQKNTLYFSKLKHFIFWDFHDISFKKSADKQITLIMDKILHIYSLLPTINYFVIDYFPKNSSIFSHNKFLSFCLSLTGIQINFSIDLYLHYFDNDGTNIKVFFRQYVLKIVKLCPNITTLDLSSGCHNITKHDVKEIAEEILLFTPNVKLKDICNLNTNSCLYLDVFNPIMMA